MKYVDEFRDKKLIKSISDKISEITDNKRTYRFMEVCGTHTMAIFRYGLRSLVPDNIQFISGPGCPVCVTEDDYIDRAIALGREKDVILATFGDMLKVPGSEYSLEEARSEGSVVKVVYSTTDALGLAKKNPEKKIVFLGVGFETTAPTIASSILEAEKKKITNYFVLSGHKIMPPALRALAGEKDTAIDGLILPAHVSAIIGSKPYEFLARKFRIPGAVSGFEPVDILQGVYMLLKQISRNKPDIEIQYKRVVKREGNKSAQDLLDNVFEKTDTAWRGLGVIKKSGLGIRKKFRAFDAEKVFNIKNKKFKKKLKGCICGRILKGVKIPLDCALFGKECHPKHPVGACMVSSEGTCAAYFKYHVKK